MFDDITDDSIVDDVGDAGADDIEVCDPINLGS